MQVFPTAFLLDPAFAVDAGGPVLPPWGSLRDRDKSAVKDVITRLAGPGKQKAAMDELVCFTGEGFVDKTFALSAMVRRPSKCFTACPLAMYTGTEQPDSAAA